MTFLELLQVNVTLKRVARTHGGEYAGPCPFCGGNDRFRVWPNEDGGRFWCRGCGKSGDAIQYLRDTRGLTFRGACLELGREPRTKHSTKMSAIADKPKPSPSLKWQERAWAFSNQAIETLWKHKEPLSFLHGRGLRDETIRAARLGWNPQDRYEYRDPWGLQPETDEEGNVRKLWLPAGLVIPLPVAGAVLRLRIRRPQGETKYVTVSGSDMRPMVFHPDRESFVIVESEVDGLLIDQEAGDITGSVALGSAQAKPDQGTDRLLERASSILVSLDFDEAGAKAAWRYWLQTYKQAQRWPVPYGKDPSDAFQRGLNVRAWVEAGLSEKKPLERKQNDETVEPFPKEWLQRFDEVKLERLAIMTIEGRLSDTEVMKLLN